MYQPITGHTAFQPRFLLEKNLQNALLFGYAFRPSLNTRENNLLARRAFIAAWFKSQNAARSLRPKDIPAEMQNGTYQYNETRGSIAYTGGTNDHAWLKKWHEHHQAGRNAFLAARSAEVAPPVAAEELAREVSTPPVSNKQDSNTHQVDKAPQSSL